MLKRSHHPLGFPIQHYLNARQAYGPSFSSDGQYLAFLTNITGLPQVWQVKLNSSPDEPPWPEQLTFSTNRVMTATFSPAHDDPRLIYGRDVGGNEMTQLFLISMDGSPEIDLTAGHENALHIFGEWARDGTRFLFAANRRHPMLFDLYLQSLDGGVTRVWQSDQPGYLYNQAFSPDGERAVVTRMSSSFDHELFEIELHTGIARQLLGGDGVNRVRCLGCAYAHDGKSLFINTDKGSDFLYIARLNLEDGILEPFIATGWDCEYMACSPDGKKLAYVVNVDGAHNLHVYDLETGTTRTAPRLDNVPGVVIDGHLTFSPDGHRVAFAFSRATRTADIFIWDLVQNHVYPITRSSHGGIPAASFIAPELIHYPTFDTGVGTGVRRRIPAWFYRPTNVSDRPMPAVVLVHGGPESQFKPAFHFLIQYLLHHGYAVLAPNVRGSTGYGKRYSHLDDVEKRMDSVADLAHAAIWLRDQADIDGEHIAVYGGSYGGFMVLAALTTYPELWTAGVNIVGISNFVTFLENTSAYRRAHREAEYGSLERDRAFLESISPLNHVDKITAPLMVIHGANDPRVPLGEAQQLVTALKDRNIPVTFLVFDDEGHGVVKLKNKLTAYPAIVAFLDQHLRAKPHAPEEVSA